MTVRHLLKFTALAAIGLIPSCSTVPMPQSSGDLGTVPAEPVKQQVESVTTRNRPGLGTGWGDAIDSSISHSKFSRAGDKPKSLDIIYYNDKEGIEAMTQSWTYRGSGMQSVANGLVEWGVKSGWGYAKNVHSGGKRYIIGRDQAQYKLVVKNICDSRLEVVLSVDGLDVMDGKSASVRKRGYIISPGQTLSVKGFRTSEDTVAAFNFSSVGNSYSNLRHGTTRNVGVIGMATYTEKDVNPWRWSNGEVNNRKSAQAFAEAPRLKAQ